MRARPCTSRLRARIAAGLAGACLAATAGAQAVDPLALVPQAQDDAAAPEPWGVRLELARDQFDRHAAAADGAAWVDRLVLDARHVWALNADWKFGWSDRVEQVHAPGGDTTRNALREVYASRAFGSAGFVDAGRIQWRNGVAYGYNPTDFLKRGALVAQTTQNPQALRENRLGTVMLRGQMLSALGSVQAALIPDLGSGPSTSATAPAWDRTNGARAVLVKVAPALGERTSVDVLGHARAGQRPRLGVNLTHLAGDAWVAHAEWAGGSAMPLTGPDEAPPAARWTQSLVAGLSWTTPSGLVLTLERFHAGDALTPARWRAWQDALVTPRAAYLGPQLGALSSARAADQEPLTRDAWFARAAWDDAFGVRHVDLAAFARINANDRSRLWQAEVRWHLSDRHSLAAMLGGYAGDARSEYGSLTLRRYAQITGSLHF